MGKSCLQDIEIPHVLEDLRTDIHLQSRGKECKDMYPVSTVSSVALSVTVSNICL